MKRITYLAAIAVGLLAWAAPAQAASAESFMGSVKAVSASSIAMVGAHFSIDRNNAAPVIETLDMPCRTKKVINFNSVVFPLFGKGEVASRIGLWTTAFS